MNDSTLNAMCNSGHDFPRYTLDLERRIRGLIGSGPARGLSRENLEPLAFDDRLDGLIEFARLTRSCRAKSELEFTVRHEFTKTLWPEGWGQLNSPSPERSPALLRNADVQILKHSKNVR